MDPSDLIGTFVVEVGQRQAWPYVTFADNRPASTVETRLYLDTNFVVEPATQHRSVLDTLVKIANLTVEDVDTAEDGGLTIVFDGPLRLMISGEAHNFTTGPPWWLGSV